jgi:flavin-dependent dehydrogenase
MDKPGSSPYDVIVVGGGPGGASAANFLGEAGRRVLVLEN